MNIGAVILLVLTFGTVLMLIQRAEARRRLLVAIIMAFVGLLAQRYAAYRELYTEAFWGFIVAVVLNLLFWVVIGRYNPPGTSDDIQVLGMDD